MNFDIFQVFSNSLNVTILVMMLMMIIEYINIRTKGSWSNFLQKHKSFQLIFAILMGLFPGCVGTFAVVSMYTHRMISLGAIVAAFIATFGDEAFFMFSLIPVTTIWMSLILIIISLIAGYVVDIFAKNRYPFTNKFESFEIHHHHSECIHANLNKMEPRKYFSWRRVTTMFIIFAYVVAILTGLTGHEHGPAMVETHIHKHHSTANYAEHTQFDNDHNSAIIQVQNHSQVDAHDEMHHSDSHDEHSDFGLETIMFLIAAAILMYILLRVNEHFLSEHLWNHVLKVHFVKVFLWTFSALLLINLLLSFFDLKTWIDSNQYAMIYLLLIALIIGIIPESGPHYIIIILFMNGLVPFSVLLANSIVQEGHGGLPLLAESKKDFFLIKGINLFIGLIVGLIGFFTGW